jgi:hypothetical protein
VQDLAAFIADPRRGSTHAESASTACAGISPPKPPSTDTTPQLFYMHFWAVDDAVTLAKPLRLVPST